MSDWNIILAAVCFGVAIIAAIELIKEWRRKHRKAKSATLKLKAR